MGSDALWHSFSGLDELLTLVEKIDFPSEAPKQPRKPRVLPYSSLGFGFVGRAAEMLALRAHFTESGAPAALVPAQAIHGLGGIGKTRLAVEYALMADAHYSALLFVSAERPGTLDADLSRLAMPECIALCDAHQTDDEIKRQLVLHWLESHSRWLLIIDNADSQDAVQAVSDLLPRLRNGHVIITSRFAAWTEGTKSIELGVLPEEAAVAYLLFRCVARAHSDADEATALVLVRELGSLALALEQAAAFINIHGLSFDEYLERWHRADAEVQGWFNPDVMRYSRSVATTWETSFAELDVEARFLLNLLCWLSTERIPRSLFTTDSAKALFGERLSPILKARPPRAVKELTEYSLIHRAGSDAVQIHKLVQEVTRSRLCDPRHHPALVQDTLRLVNAYATGNPYEPAAWPTWDPLRPHILSLGDWSEAFDIDQPIGRLMNQVGLLLLRKAVHKQALSTLKRALVFQSSAHGINSLEAATVRTNLGTVCERLDQLQEAEHHHLYAIQMLQALDLDETQDMANALANIASLYVTMNRFAEAERFMKLADHAEILAGISEGPQRASSLSNRGGLLWRLASYDEAHSCYLQAIEMMIRHAGREHPEVAAMKSNLGLLLQDLGRYDQAEEYFREAHAIDVKLFGTNHPAVGRDANNLALVLRLKGKLAEAERLLLETLVSDEATYGTYHSEMADGFSNLGLVLIDLERIDEAKECFRKALRIDKTLHGINHLRVATVCVNLSHAHRLEGYLKKALCLCRKALDIQRSILGASHPDVASTLHNISKLLQTGGHCAEARSALLRAMRIDRRALGKRHPRLGTRLNNLAQIYWQEGRLDRADRLYRLAIKMDRNILGEDHPEVAVDLYNHSELLRHQGRMQESDQQLSQAAAIASADSDDPRIKAILKQWRSRLQIT